MSGNGFVVNAFSIEIKKEDLRTLSGRNWLNDEVINYLIRLLTFMQN